MQDDTDFVKAYIDGEFQRVLRDLQRNLQSLGITLKSTHNVVHTQESLWMLDLRLEAVFEITDR